MPTFDRRQLLRSLTAAPLVYGLSGTTRALLQGQDPARPGEPSPWLAAALRRSAETDTPLVGFVLPEGPDPEPADPKRAAEKKAFDQRVRLLLERRPEVELRLKKGDDPVAKGSFSTWSFPFESPRARLVVNVQLLVESPRYAMKELFVEATWVCVRRAEVGAAPEENVVLLDAHGQRRAGLMVDLANERAFESRVRHMLHSAPDFRERVARARTPAIEDAIRALARPDKRNAARKLLTERLPKHRAALIQTSQEGTGYYASLRELRKIIEAAHTAASPEGLAGPMPFGVELVDRMLYDPCPPCGMVRVPASSRKMISFLAKRQPR